MSKNTEYIIECEVVTLWFKGITKSECTKKIMWKWGQFDKKIIHDIIIRVYEDEQI